MSILTRSHITGFPVFCISQVGNNDEFLAGGGGGATKAGVKNSIIYFKVDPVTLELTIIEEVVLSKLDDGCMSVSAHPLKRVFIAGVNGPQEVIKMGENINARFFYIQNSRYLMLTSIKYCLEKSVQTLTNLDPIHYQKVGRFSKDGKVFVAGTSDGYLSFWNWPEMSPSLPAQSLNEEILDLHIDPTSANVLVVTPQKLRILDLQKGKIRWALEDVVIGTKCDFRAARFGSRDSDGLLYVVLNSKDKKSAYIQKYQISDWKLIKTKKVASKPITVFSISYVKLIRDRGDLIVFGSSDMSVTILYSDLSTLIRVPDVHSFAVTSIDFNQLGTVVVSGSADGTICVLAVPVQSQSGRFGIGTILLIVLMLLGLFIALIPIDEPEL